MMRIASGLLLGGLLSTLVGPALAGEVFSFDRVRAGLDSNRIHLVDVREADEFAAGHVPGSVNMPLSAFKVEQLPPPSEIPVVLMCRSGRRAGEALAIAEAAGRSDVGVYPGSMIEWTEKNGPVVAGP
ncbi:Rhodanese-like domain-containing protein [Pleomorphomonas diazotrophica]|nr:rhodanese-like domain-containing protein [Pleomorphomonas diazotrophica]SFM41071.1 Rhodanese-like domain-containing protein [Pleomorphomonas diazotrophica]